MTNEEAIRYLSQMYLIQFDSKEHESLTMAINSIQENTKLKAEIEQLKKQRETRIKVSEANFNIYSKLEIERDNLVAEIEQLKDDSKIIAKELVTQIREIDKLKSELEQSVKLPCKVGQIVYLLDFDENKYDEATVEEIVITKNGKIEINSDYEIGTWSEDTYIKYSLKEAEQSLKCEVSND